MLNSLQSALMEVSMSGSNPFTEESLVTGLASGNKLKEGTAIFNSLNPNCLTTKMRYKTEETDGFIPAGQEGSLLPNYVDVKWVAISIRDYHAHLVYMLEKLPSLNSFFSAGDDFFISPKDLKVLMEKQKQVNGVSVNLTWMGNSMAKIKRDGVVEVIVQNPLAMK